VSGSLRSILLPSAILSSQAILETSFVNSTRMMEGTLEKNQSIKLLFIFGEKWKLGGSVIFPTSTNIIGPGKPSGNSFGANSSMSGVF
jgi:hypothetical protein